MQFLGLDNIFYVDKLTMIMFALIGFIGFVVLVFSNTYMQGEKHKKWFLYKIILLCSSIAIMVAANNIVLFLTALLSSNLILINLMTYNRRWQASKASGFLTARYLSLGFLCVAFGFGILYLQTKQFNIQEIINAKLDFNIIVALTIIFIGVMIQSALWPFNRWLLSSLNAPTPVSAIMHAGLINGGGWLLIRLAPFYLKNQNLLNIIFIIGLISALFGTLLKLTQNDYKRMLASSTIGQMGFMIMQCGLGLFSFAIIHLCWHGIFKAYLFLISGSAAQGGANATNAPLKLNTLLLAFVIGGIFGSYVFSFSSSIAFYSLDTNLLMKGLIFIAGTQFALTILTTPGEIRIGIAILATSIIAISYGFIVNLSHKYLNLLDIDLAQPLNIFHVIGFTLLLLSWLSILCRAWICSFTKLDSIRSRLYVNVLNSCQPHEATITTSRDLYNF